MTNRVGKNGHPIHFQDENGLPYGIERIGNVPRVSSRPYTYDIAEGSVSGLSSIRKFGHNDDVGAALETVWGAGGLYPWPASAEILKVSSSEAEDDGDPVGDGARTMQLFGLDANYALQNETITLNGEGAVSTTKSYIRLFRAVVLTAGVSLGNEGTISVKNNANAITLLSIEPLKNQTLAAIFTIPAGCTGHIVCWFTATSSNKVTEANLFVKPFGQVFQVRAHLELNQGQFQQEFAFPEIVPEKSDIDLRASAVGGGGAVGGGFELWYETN